MIAYNDLNGFPIRKTQRPPLDYCRGRSYTIVIGAAVDSVVSVAGNVISAVVGFGAGLKINFVINADGGNGSIVDHVKDCLGFIADGIADIWNKITS